jgi:photosystem II stability/assembly factor-like uncharacterized protein
MRAVRQPRNHPSIKCLTVAGLVAAAAFAQSSAGIAARPHPVVVTTLLRVAFTSPSRGVGLFLRSVSQRSDRGRCLLSARTTVDGGTRFQTAGRPIFTAVCGSSYPVGQVASDDAGDLFAYAPGLIESQNDGRHWQRVRLGGTIMALATEGRSAWALRMTGCSHYPGVCVLTLFVSTDAGRSWHAATNQPPRRRLAYAVAASAASGSTWLLRSSATSATVVLPPSAGSTAAILEQTSDAGRSWTAEKAPCSEGGGAIDYSVASSGAQWLACAGEPGAGEQQKSFAVSLNRGATWRQGPSCTLATRCDKGMPINGSLGGLAATNASTAFYVGGRSSLTATRNGGRSWTAEPGFSGDASGTAEVTFAGAGDGWAIDLGVGGHSVLWRTRDGGAHWTRVATP